MSRRERRKAKATAPHAGRGEGAARRPRGPSLRVLAVAAALIAVGIAAWLWLRPFERPAPVASRVDPSHPAARLTPEAANDTATRLSLADRDLESLPYYLRALEGSPNESWTTHSNYASSLYKAQLAVRYPFGVGIPVVRSSVERVAMMREAFEEYAVAERLTKKPEELALLLTFRAGPLKIWGLPLDSFGQMWQAQRTNPSAAELQGRLEVYTMRLRYPDSVFTIGPDKIQ